MRMPTVTRTRPVAAMTRRTLGRLRGETSCTVTSPPPSTVRRDQQRFVQWRPISPEGCVSLVVRLRSAVCLLGRFPALAGVDLDVAPGEIVLLSGPNGAGKTTLLRLLAGLVPLHAGEADVLGHDLSLDRRSHRRELSLLGHDTFCYDDLTVGENLRFAS